MSTFKTRKQIRIEIFHLEQDFFELKRQHKREIKQKEKELLQLRLQKRKS